MADRLVKRGSYLAGEGPEPYLPVSDSIIKEKIKKWGEEKHQAKWSGEVKYRQTRMMLPKIKNKSWHYIQRMKRREAMYSTQILTGHAQVNKHLFNLKVVRSTKCEKCDFLEESIEHLLGNCPAYNTLRRDVLGDYTIPSGDMCRLDLLKLMRFVNRSKRFIFTEET